MNEHDSPADKDRPSKVGIYCRISAGGVAQLKKLSEQLSALARYAAAHDSWRLSDIYLDMPNGRNRAHREEFERMSGDCAAGRLDIILLKTWAALAAAAQISLPLSMMQSNMGQGLLPLMTMLAPVPIQTMSSFRQ